MKQASSLIKATTLLSIFVLTACGGGGGSGSEPDVNSPPTLLIPALDELDPMLLTTNVAFAPIQFTNAGGGELTACNVDVLPQGLAVAVSTDASTCVLSGTATEVQDATTHTVTAVNASGDSNATVSIQVDAPTAYITTWKTDNDGDSEDNEITIEVSSEFTYNFRVEWGDGTVDENVTDDITHTYDLPDTYEIAITGIYPQPFFDGDTDSLKLISVEQWGNRSWLSMEQAFFDADNLVINDVASPDLSRVTSMKNMFAEADNFNSDISAWDVSNVTDFFAIFAFADSFNQDISVWDVSNATNMQAMFREAIAFNQDISVWNVSNVTNMQAMLRDTSAFNQNLDAWNISNVSNMSDMLLGNALSSENYSALLNGWAVQSVQQNVTFDAAPAQFNVDAESARTALTDTFGWIITDSGRFIVPNIESTTITLYTNNSLPLKLNNTGGVLTECASADLPDGLAVQVSADFNTCEIIGTPTLEQSFTKSTVIATNALGSASATIDIEVIVETAFITTWKTDNEGASENNEITLKVSPDFNYNFRVEWGDGAVDENVSEDIIHTYDSPGTYDVTITGTFPQPFFDSTFNTSLTDASKLLSVEQWGDRPWLSMEQAFFDCRNLVINDPEAPDLSRVTSMKSMFNNADNLAGEIGAWDVSNIADMSFLFSGADSFNLDIGGWNVSNVTNMESMFNNALVFDQDLSAWNVSSVTNMKEMLRRVANFNSDISAWDVSSVTNMKGALAGTLIFNQDLGDWDVSNVTDMSEMFRTARLFNQDISRWNVSNVTNMGDMFNAALTFDQNVGGWDVSSVINMNKMFNGNGLSTENYDALLSGWSQLGALQTGVNFSVGNTQFSAGSQAVKDILANDFSWIITDGGQQPIP